MLHGNSSRLLALLLAAALVGVGCSSAGEGPTPTPEVTPTPEATPEPTPEAPTPKPLAVKVTKVTKSVAAGDSASVTVTTVKGAACSITVTYDSGDSTAKGLGDKKANADGVAAWKWAVGRNTNPQKALVTVLCQAGERSGIVQADIVVK